MKAGFARLDITPPLGAAMSGYFHTRLADGILDPLQAHAVAFDDGEKQAAVISLDLIGICQEEMDQLRQTVVKKTGLPYEAIFVACTHTHTGPYVSAKDMRAIVDPAYNQYLYNRVADAVTLALADREETTMEIGRGEAKGISFVRRFRMRDGSVKTNPGNDPAVVGPIGTPDESLQVVKLRRETKADIVIVNFQVHPDTVGGCKLGADYPGYVRRILEDALRSEKGGKGIHAVYFNGAQGDTNHIDIHARQLSSPKHTEHMGRVIAGNVLALYSYTKPVAGDKIAFGQMVADVPSNRGTPEQVQAAKELVQFNEEHPAECAQKYPGMMHATVMGEAEAWLKLEFGPDSFGLYLTGVSVGPLAFVGLPGEPFTDIGRGLKEKSPFEMTIPCCCAGGYQGYFPMESAYAEGGYEARSSKFRPGVAEALIATGTELLCAMHKG